MYTHLKYNLWLKYMAMYIHKCQNLDAMLKNTELLNSLLVERLCIPKSLISSTIDT